MIQISENLQLKAILNSEAATLFNLIQEIYPPAYSHFWEDKGTWYLQQQYAIENVLKEIDNPKAAYYFVIYKGEIVGNFRFIWDEKLDGLSAEKQVKLHRIYLHQKIQGKGIGKAILAWLEEKATQKGYTFIWLDAMDHQPQAFQFYKKLGYVYYSHRFLTFDLMLDKFKKMSQLYKKL
jgi:GNAT superfamily N-acetyltransferase